MNKISKHMAFKFFCNFPLFFLSIRLVFYKKLFIFLLIWDLKMIRSVINPTESSELEKFAASKEGKGLFEINKRKKEVVVSSSDDDDDERANGQSGEENEQIPSDIDLDEFKDKKERMDDEEKDLETLVFGSESSILVNIDRLNKKKKEKKRVKKSKKNEPIGETLIQAESGRKPAWQDTADQEL